MSRFKLLFTLCQTVRYKRVEEKIKKPFVKYSVSFACLLFGPNEK